MKLYYSPGSCALGIHVLLEEIGAPFELKRLNFAEREQYGEAYVTINPKSKVPTLERDDGSVLTEYQAISTCLALTYPEKRLIPADIERQTAMDYVVGTIHGQGFRLVFRPLDYAPHEADQGAIKARGLEKANRGLALIDKDLVGKDWIVGDFSLADPALFYVSWWAVARLKTGLPTNVKKHFERMMDRPSVKRALEDEDLRLAS
jgi:glutathione S-transferase